MDIEKLYKVENLTKFDIRVLKTYNSAIEEHIFNRIANETITNSSNYRASLLFTKLFEKTQNKLCMVVGRLDGNVSNLGGYSKELEKALERINDAQIIFLDNPNIESAAYQLFSTFQNSKGNVKSYLGNENTKMELKKQFPNLIKEAHFSIFDDDKYRLEVNPESYAAIASFYAPDDTKKYISIFEILKQTAQKFSL